MPHALIEDGVVVQLDLSGNPPDGFVEVPGDVQPGYAYADGVFSPPAPSAPNSGDVDHERNRRIAAGFVFDGVLFQARPDDRENIDGAQSAAKDAIALGAQPGDFSWRRLLDPAGPAVFAWIATDNSLVPMDAQTVVRFAYAALTHKDTMIFTARTIKDMTPIPVDYADSAYWP